MRHFLTTQDWGRADLQAILDKAVALKHNPFQPKLTGRSVALVFFNPSTRTRTSFSVGIHQMGGHSVVLEPGQGSWGMEFQDGVVMDGDAEEHVSEAARVLSRYCDLIAVRAFPKFKRWEDDREDLVIKQFAKYATVPVVNMETITHPMQELALMMALQEKLGQTDKKKFVLTWTYHPKPLNTAVANSALLIASKFGMDVTLLCPTPEYVLDDRYMEAARQNAREQGGSVTVSHDIHEAYHGARRVRQELGGAALLRALGAREAHPRRAQALHRGRPQDGDDGPRLLQPLLACSAQRQGDGRGDGLAALAGDRGGRQPPPCAEGGDERVGAPARLSPPATSPETNTSPALPTTCAAQEAARVEFRP
jgi:N-acetylornithine carbamoyltransferase